MRFSLKLYLIHYQFLTRLPGDLFCYGLRTYTQLPHPKKMIYFFSPPHNRLKAAFVASRHVFSACYFCLACALTVTALGNVDTATELQKLTLPGATNQMWCVVGANETLWMGIIKRRG